MIYPLFKCYAVTTTVQVSFTVTPSTVIAAVIIVFPALFPVTTPPLTVATVVLSELHVTVWPDGVVLAVRVTVSSSGTVT